MILNLIYRSLRQHALSTLVTAGSIALAVTVPDGIDAADAVLSHWADAVRRAAAIRGLVRRLDDHLHASDVHDPAPKPEDS